MTHSPEPWVLSDHKESIYDKDFQTILGGEDGRDYNPVSEEDAERIVACVNACAGIPTKDMGKVRMMVLCKLKGDEINAYIYGETEPKPPTPRMLEEFLELTWGVKTKVEIP